MSSNFTFHNVGQGLFYSGRVVCSEGKEFNFVYDCGATQKTANDRSPTLDTCIKRYTQYLNKKKIDMLVISHFHEDHINGVEELLAKNSIDILIIPFYTFEERFVTYFNEDTEEISDDKLEFLKNPYQYFFDLGVKKIYVVKHEENKHDNLNIRKISSIDEPGREFNLNLESPINPNEDDFKELNELNNRNIILINDLNKFLLNDCWEFAFFADDKFKHKFDLDAAKKGIRNLKNAKNKKDRKSAIKEIKASYNLASGCMNETSLIMVHKFKESKELLSLSFNHQKYFFRDYFESRIRAYEGYINIMSGDFNFNKGTSWRDVSKHFGNFITNNKLCFYQVSHHGSLDNWDKNILRDFKKVFCFIPYGTINKYGHPSLSVKEDISRNYCRYIDITENESLMMLY